MEFLPAKRVCEGGKRQTASELEEVVNQRLSLHPTLALHLRPISRENHVQELPNEGAEQTWMEKSANYVNTD